MSPCCLPRVVAGPNMVGLDRRSRRHGHVDGGRPIQRSCAPPAVLPCSHSPRSPTFHRPLSILSSRNTLNRGLLLGSRHVQLRGRALGSLGLALAQLVRLPQLSSSMVVVRPSVVGYGASDSEGFVSAVPAWKAGLCATSDAFVLEFRVSGRGTSQVLYFFVQIDMGCDA
ncbi:hypothetical protein MSAN_01892300 [Mycena sanguinolenta]|uniref:Uncharacterized protein n=1 Tax=Mycena sanguinolenta TaxID=230812 RepID=A0A8H7CPB4_9AGAR|nr:hypothetical protein MSAN_01892300 [Mycena sanguinolenta]